MPIGQIGEFMLGKVMIRKLRLTCISFVTASTKRHLTYAVVAIIRPNSFD